MRLAVVDASVIVAVLEPQDAHHERAREMLRDRSAAGDVALPASAYAETLVYPARAGRKQVAAVDSFLDRAAIAVVPIDRATARQAAALRAQHGIGLPDALVLASGDVLGAEVVLTADHRWADISDRVTVV